MMGFELNSSGVAMDQLNRVYRNYDVQTGWICFILEFIFMSLIGIYLENVIPRKEGRRAHWLFCCNKKFWCKPKVSLAKVAPNEDADFVTTNHAFET
jgi:ATP-binding cassette subfamily A (ABC1) protein 3